MASVDDIKFLGDGAVVVDKAFGDHEEPAVGEAFGNVGAAVEEEAGPCEDLVGGPAVGVVPLAVGALKVDVAAGGERAGGKAARFLEKI